MPKVSRANEPHLSWSYLSASSDWESSKINNPDNRKKIILVVEDEPAISSACQRVLTSEGFEVEITVNRLIAQDMINKQQYDLCLIDIRTPAINGKKLYQ